MSPLPHPRPSAALRAALLLALAACDGSPAAPAPHGEDTGSFERALAVNEIASGTVRQADAGRYTVLVPRGRRFAVLLEVRAGKVGVDVLDGAGTWVTGRGAEADGHPFGTASSSVVTASGAPYVLRLRGEGSFRLEAYVADSAPETAPRRVAVGDTVAAESLHAASDVDAFTFHAAKGDSLVALAQTTDAAYQKPVLFGVVDAAGQGLAGVGTSSVAGGTLAESSVGPFAIPADGDYTLRVTGGSFMDVGEYAGPYRFLLRRHDGRPEHAAVALPVGETVATEVIDYAGDVDDFVLTGTPGAQYDVLLQAPNDDPETHLQVEARGTTPDNPRGDPATVVSSGRDSLLTDRGTGRFTLPASGRAVVRVTATRLARAASPYRLRAVAVDPRPETSAPTLVLGDSVIAERIAEPGDVDEFALDVAAPTLVNIVLEIAPGPGGWPSSLEALGVQILRDGGDPAPSPMVAWRNATDTPMRQATGAFTLPAGHHRLRVAAAEGRVRSFFGPYRLYVYRLDPRPDSTAVTLTVGDTVSDAIDPVGDTDRYEFDGVRGDHLELAILGLGEPTPGSGFVAIVRRVGGSTAGLLGGVIGGSSSPIHGTTLDAQAGGRFSITESGRYEVLVYGADGESRSAVARGAYRLALRRYPSGPETHRAELALGETVDDERLDVGGDVDEFTVRGVPGSLAVGRITLGDSTPGIVVELVDPTTREVLGSAQSYAETGATLPVPFPAGGALLVRVLDPLHEGRGAWPLVGGYRLQVVAAEGRMRAATFRTHPTAPRVQHQSNHPNDPSPETQSVPTG